MARSSRAPRPRTALLALALCGWLPSARSFLCRPRSRLFAPHAVERTRGGLTILREREHDVHGSNGVELPLEDADEFLTERNYEKAVPDEGDWATPMFTTAGDLLKSLVDFRLGKGAEDNAVQDLYRAIRELPLVQPMLQSWEEGQGKAARSTCLAPFHLHIGAGRLGLGLVVPAVRKSQTPLAILQRPSGAWEQAFPPGPHTIDVLVNDEVVCSKMNVVRDVSELPATEKNSEQPDLFVVSNDRALLKLLVSTATSFSMSLGPYMHDVVPLLEHLPYIDDSDVESCPRPVLYAAENDHKMVMEVAKALEGRVDVCTVMVDRICTGRVVKGDKVEVVCEPYTGEIVVILRPSSNASIPPPFDGDHVRVPDKEAQAQYFCRRKLLLVNGSHTTLAFMTLCRNQPRKREPGTGGALEATEPGDHELINWDVSSCGEEGHKEIWAWAVARLLMLLSEYDTSLLRDAHRVDTDDQLCDELLSYARDTLSRFSSTKDTTSRVLNGGVENRFETRLKTVDRFLENFHMTPAASLLLTKADVRLPYIKKVVSRLCADSKRFTRTRSMQPV